MLLLLGIKTAEFYACEKSPVNNDIFISYGLFDTHIKQGALLVTRSAKPDENKERMVISYKGRSGLSKLSEKEAEKLYNDLMITINQHKNAMKNQKEKKGNV